MPRVTFPQVLQRHVSCPPVQVEGRTVKQALAAACAHYDNVEGYLLDESGALRPHITIFVDGNVLQDREELGDPVQGDSRIDVLQALSGG